METIPEIMAAVLLTGHGGFDRLEYRTDVPALEGKIERPSKIDG
jgi:hypothetical protein